MNSKLLLRIAALLILVHLLGHAVGHFSWKDATDPVKQEVIKQMTGPKFPFMGATRSMGDYYEGYGLILFFVYFMTISILVTVSGMPSSQTSTAKKLLYPIAITYIAFGIIEFLHFFPFAAGISLGAGLLTIVSIFYMKR